MKRWLVPILVLIGSAMPVAAQAAPLEREQYSGTDSFNFDDCGFVVHDEVTFEGTFLLKAPRDEGAPPYLFDNYETHETLTANGRTLTIDHQGLDKDLHITLVEDTVYQFVAMEALANRSSCATATAASSSETGACSMTTFQVDTLGDTDLENDVFIEDSFALLADHGRHPGFLHRLLRGARGVFLRVASHPAYAVTGRGLLMG